LRLKRRREEKKRGRDSMYDQTTKGTARKKAGISYIGKGAGIL